MTFDEWKKSAIFTQQVLSTDEWMRLAFDAATKIEREACADVCKDYICGSRGFAGPTCCILQRGHDGAHSYGVPTRKSAAQCEREIRARGDK